MYLRKIALCHDSFVCRGGSELVALKLAEHYKADIYTLAVDPAKTFSEYVNLVKLRFYVPSMQLPIKPAFVHLAGYSWFSKLNLYDNYDVVIASGTLGLYACLRNHPNLWYCNSPTTYFYHSRHFNFIMNNENLFKKMQMLFHKVWGARIERYVAKNHVDLIVSYSQTVARRIRRFYERNSITVYPSIVDYTEFKCKDYEDFFLVVQRLHPLKRTALIIEAFKHLPSRRVIVVGEGIEMQKLKLLAQGCSNIEFRGSVPRDELLDLYSRCLATIYVPVDEDFGLVPIESMASGKPCIAADEGGVRERIINHKTGFLIKPTVQNLIAQINQLTPERAAQMKEYCLRRAREFGIWEFFANFDKALNMIWKNHHINEVNEA
jgi:glycosyltransferase involved in cell wall biosynthesis